jgi:hypothetical protein
MRCTAASIKRNDEDEIDDYLDSKHGHDSSQQASTIDGKLATFARHCHQKTSLASFRTSTWSLLLPPEGPE